jgi:hypothetical protein
MRRRISSKPVRVGFIPTFRINKLAIRRQKAGHDEEGGGGEIAGHREVQASQAVRGMQAVRKPSTSTRTPHPNSIRSLWSRLMAGRNHRGGSLGIQARQKNGRLHLGTGHRQPVFDPVQSATAAECRPAAGLRECAHRRPSRASGFATRSMGRFISDASPIRLRIEGCAAKGP